MRKLIINSLLADLPENCEWGSVLRDHPEVPYSADGFIDYHKFPKVLLSTFSDQLLLELYDSNACLRYR